MVHTKSTHRFFVQFQFYILQMLENRFIVSLKTKTTNAKTVTKLLGLVTINFILIVNFQKIND